AYSHQDLYFETDLDHVGFVMPTPLLNKDTYMGISITRLGLPDQQGRGTNREKTGRFDTSDLAIGAALASNFGSFQLGSQFKFLRQELAEFNAQGVAVDLGVLTRTPLSCLSIGGAVRNLGPKMKFISEEFYLPLTLSIGAAYQLMSPLTIGMDVQSQPHQDKLSLSFGTEFLAVQNIVLRAGYLSKMAESITNNQISESNRGNIATEGLTAGLGLRYKNFHLDYAFSQFGELGLTHSFTISTSFGSERIDSLSSSSPVSLPPPEKSPTPSPPSEPDRIIVIFAAPYGEDQWWN
ncbi:hypothetical protein BVX98_02435, partial [bacterium F11]